MTEGSLSPTAREYLAAANLRQEEFIRSREGHGHGFVASDPIAVHLALSRISHGQLAPGERFCEWGSGLGVAAGLAALLGFESVGIELQPDLVTAATELAEEFDIPVTFATGTFVPASFVWPEGVSTADHPWWDTAAPSGYDELGLAPTELDVFFAYPWPGEQRIIDEVFSQCAAEGALLLTFEDGAGIRLRRRGRGGSLEEMSLGT